MILTVGMSARYSQLNPGIFSEKSKVNLLYSEGVTLQFLNWYGAKVVLVWIGVGILFPFFPAYHSHFSKKILKFCSILFPLCSRYICTISEVIQEADLYGIGLLPVSVNGELQREF